MATHDIWRAREVADHVVVMARGRLVLELDPRDAFRRGDRAEVLLAGIRTLTTTARALRAGSSMPPGSVPTLERVSS